jgi:hypothetical protein
MGHPIALWEVGSESPCLEGETWGTRDFSWFSVELIYDLVAGTASCGVSAWVMRAARFL